MAQAEVVLDNLKRHAEAHPERPPSAITRDELNGKPPGVLAMLPDRANLTRAIRRGRRRNMPSNPTSLADLEEVPGRFQLTATKEQFLIYDSRDDEDADLGDGRVLVFSTRRNIEVLATSEVWYLDGTFKVRFNFKLLIFGSYFYYFFQVAPTIFTQVFTILGSKEGNRRHAGGPRETVSLPLVYALLSSKEQRQYTTVLRAVQAFAEDEIGIQNFRPQRIMSDFEKGIINASSEVFEDAVLAGCFFHLGQSVYRKLQDEGLQNRYNGADGEIKIFTHMLTALAFVPLDDVRRVFNSLKNEAPEDLEQVFNYFQEFYVSGRPARGRGRGRTRAVEPRYPPSFWNVYEATLNGQHRTNNISEGWHNRFHVLMGKNHPDLYSALQQFQKEQGNTEISLIEVGLGKMLKAAPKRTWYENQNRLRNIVEQYDVYQNKLDYLRVLAYTIIL